jgi:hypothetical protein
MRARKQLNHEQAEISMAEASQPTPAASQRLNDVAATVSRCTQKKCGASIIRFECPVLSNVRLGWTIGATNLVLTRRIRIIAHIATVTQ